HGVREWVVSSDGYFRGDRRRSVLRHRNTDQSLRVDSHELGDAVAVEVAPRRWLEPVDGERRGWTLHRDAVRSSEEDARFTRFLRRTGAGPCSEEHEVLESVAVHVRCPDDRAAFASLEHVPRRRREGPISFSEHDAEDERGG